MPVYAGADNITEYIPKGCFINYFDYKSPEELVGCLRTMNEIEYNKHIDNIKAFLSNTAAVHKWSADAWNDYLAIVLGYKFSEIQTNQLSVKRYAFEVAFHNILIKKVKKMYFVYMKLTKQL